MGLFVMENFITIYHKTHIGENPYINVVNMKRHSSISPPPQDNRELSMCFLTLGRSCLRNFISLIIKNIILGRNLVFLLNAVKPSLRNPLSICQRIHMGQKPMNVFNVRRPFPWSHISLYSRVHTEEKPYEFHECGKSFCNKSLHFLHQKMKTKEKPSECAEYGLTFSQI